MQNIEKFSSAMNCTYKHRNSLKIMVTAVRQK